MKFSLLTLLLCFTSFAYSQSVGVIDMDKTFQSYYKTISAEKEIKKQRKNMEDRSIQIDRQQQIVKAELEKLKVDSIDITLNEKARQGKKMAAQKKAIELQRLLKAKQSFGKHATEMMQKNYNDKRSELLEEIHKVIKMISKERQYKMIVDKSGKTSNLISSVVYSKEDMNITDAVLSILNKGHEKEVEEWEKEKEKLKKEAEKKASGK